MGAMASGKSTQRKLLCERLSDNAEPIVTDKKIKDKRIIYTSFSDIVGMPGKASTNQCDGLDSSFGAMKKVGSIEATRICVKKHKITIVEGSQTSFFWIDDLIEMCQRYECDFYVVHLFLSDEVAIQRLYHRNEIKGTEVNEKKIINVKRKNMQYKNMFDKIKNFDGPITKRLKAKKSEEEVFQDIIDFIFED